LSRSEKIYEHNGEKFTARELSIRTGFVIKTIHKLAREGKPFVRRQRYGGARRYEFDGRLLTARKIATLLDRPTAQVSARLKAGIPLDAPWHEASAAELTESGERKLESPKLGESLFDDKLSFHDDLCARHAYEYLAGSQPISSDEEIRAAVADWVREEFGPAARVSDEGVAWLRERLAEHLFPPGNRTYLATLDVLGDMFGMSREAVRQDQMSALVKGRARIGLTGQAKDLLAELRERDTLRRETHAERMDMLAPGGVDLGPWERTHSMAQIAKLNGRNPAMDELRVRSAKRGSDAMRGRRRGRAA
jgi:hypothetical protein